MTPRRQIILLALLTIAATALGYGLNLREGLYSPGAIWCLSVALACTVLAAVLFSRRSQNVGPHSAPDPSPPTSRLRAFVPSCLLLALSLQFLLLYAQYPGSLWNAPPNDIRKELSRLKDQAPWIEDPAQRAAAYDRMIMYKDRLPGPSFYGNVLVAAAFAVFSLLPWRPAWRYGLPLLLGCHFALGAWMIRSSPKPYIDVWVFQQESCAALLQGKSPYSITFANIYGPNSAVYGQQVQQRDRVNFGFPYTPLSLYMALPGYIIMGDHRYSQLLAMTLAGLLIATSAPGIIPRLAALLLLFTPRAFMIIELGWTEPFVVLLLAATLFTAQRFPRALPWIFGLFLATKQYLLFAIPLGLLILPPRQLLKSLIFAAVISLSLIALDLRGFIDSALILQFKQPFRPDAMSYLAHIWWNYSKPLAEHLGPLAFLAAIAAAGWSTWKLPRTPAAFALAIALTYLLFLAFNKQAFCNYYYFVLAALCTAIAVLALRPAPPAPT